MGKRRKLYLRDNTSSKQHLRFRKSEMPEISAQEFLLLLSGFGSSCPSYKPRICASPSLGSLGHFWSCGFTEAPPAPPPGRSRALVLLPWGCQGEQVWLPGVDILSSCQDRCAAAAASPASGRLLGKLRGQLDPGQALGGCPPAQPHAAPHPELSAGPAAPAALQGPCQNLLQAVRANCNISPTHFQIFGRREGEGSAAPSSSPCWITSDRILGCLGTLLHHFHSSQEISW